MRFAIIGGIGSGKSVALDVARNMGFNCASADEINAQLLADKDYISRIDKAFDGVVKNGVVDKAKLASIVFSNKAEREKLNSIAHPIIKQRILENEKSPYVVEVPLILESGLKDCFDEIMLVNTSLFRRIARLKKRGMSALQAVKRIRSQVPISKLKKIATIEVDNNVSEKEFRDTVEVVLENFCTAENVGECAKD